MNDTQKLLESLENLIKLANEHEDGHLTIYKFTGGWKVMFGTTVLDMQGRLHVQYLQGSENLKEAIDICISTSKALIKTAKKS